MMELGYGRRQDMLVYFRLIGETDRTVLLKISREIQEDSAEELVATSPAWRSVHDFDASQHASPVSAGHFDVPKARDFSFHKTTTTTTPLGKSRTFSHNLRQHHHPHHSIKPWAVSTRNRTWCVINRNRLQSQSHPQRLGQ